jgi:hypothetical protein
MVMPDTRLAELVLAVVRRDTESARRIAGEIEVRPQPLADTCREADVHPWVHHRLTDDAESGGGLRLDETTLRPLAHMRRKVRNDTMLLLAGAERAIGALRDVGVVPVALKGLDFLHRLYPRVDLRATDDIDLLIRRRDLRTALEALRASGWRLPSPERTTHYIRSSHHLPLHSEEGLPVDLELHWNLAQEVRYTIDPESLYERALPLDVGGREVLRLDDTDVVSHLLLHHFSHYFDRRLKWLVDLQRIDAQPDGIDWSAVARRLREWGGTVAAGISLVHLKKLQPDLIPDRALADLPVAAWRRLLVRPLRSDHPLELFRGTRRRRIQLYLAAVMMERPSTLPGWIRHRAGRDAVAGDHPLDDGSPSGPATTRRQT